jgi:hypothetical protein
MQSIEFVALRPRECERAGMNRAEVIEVLIAGRQSEKMLGIAAGLYAKEAIERQFSNAGLHGLLHYRLNALRNKTMLIVEAIRMPTTDPMMWLNANGASL